MALNGIIRTDGRAWENLFTGLGRRRDRVATTTVSHQQLWLGKADLEALYVADGLGKRIIDIMPQDGTRKWFEIPEDTDGKIVKYLNQRRLKAKKNVRDAWRWARLYGGCLMVFGLDDGGDFETPLNERAVRSFEFIRLYDRFRVTWMETDLIQDVNDENYGLPEFYTVQPVRSASYRVHHTRTHLIQGADIPEDLRLRNNGWNVSEFEAIVQHLKVFANAHGGAANIIVDFIQATLSVTGLQRMIAAGDIKLIMDRLEIMNRSRSILNTILLDENEKYDKKASSISGLPDLLDRFCYLLCSVTGIPMTRLFGRSPGGLNANGDNETVQWYDDVAAEQEDKIFDACEKLKNFALLARDCAVTGAPDKFNVEFCDLWEQDEETTSKVRLANAQADQIYMQEGALHPQEVANSRFSEDGDYGNTIKLDPALQNEMQQQEDERMAEELKQMTQPKVIAAPGGKRGNPA